MATPFAVSDLRKIGIGLTAFGLSFSILGVALFFDKQLLAMGNALFLVGVMLIIGPRRSVRFFFQKRKVKGSIFFFVGMAMVLIGVPILGMAIEVFGFVNLFGDFFPVVIAFLRRMPVLGNVLTLPGFKFTGSGYIPDKDDRAETSSDVPTQLTLPQQLLLKQYQEQVDRMGPEECRKLAIEIARQMMVKDNILRKLTKKDVDFGIEPPDPDDFQTPENRS